MIKYKLFLTILVVLFGWWIYFLTNYIILNDLLFILIGMFMCMMNASVIVGTYADYKRERGKANYDL